MTVNLKLDDFSKWLIDSSRREAEKYYDPSKRICLIPRETLWYAITLLVSSKDNDIELANEILENINASDGTHSQATMVVIWYKFKDLLSEKSIANILQNIKKAFPVSAYSRFNDGNINHPLGAYCNLICGAEITGNNEIIEIGKKYLFEFEKQIKKRHKTFDQVQVSEYFSPTYTALSIWFLNIISSYSNDPEIKELSIKLEQRFWIDTALRFHAPTMQFAGPFSRAYQDDSIGGYSAMHCTLIKAAGKDIFFNPSVSELFDHPSNYIQNALIALLDFNLPEEFLNLAFDKSYPLYYKQKTFCEQYFENSSIKCTDGTNKHLFDDEVYPGGFSDLTTYMTPGFTLGSAERQYVNGGHTDSFVFRYKRADQILEQKDFGSWMTRGVFNNSVVGEKNICHVCGYEIDKSYLYEEGRSAIYQNKESAIILYTPKTTCLTGIKSFRIEIIGNYFDDFSEIIIGKKKISEFPYEFSYDDKIIISDKEMYYSFIPIRSSRIRKYEKNGLKNRIWRKDNFIIISIYSYSGEDREFTKEELKQLLNGFLFNAHAKSDFKTFDDYCQIINDSFYEIQEERYIKILYRLDENTLFLRYDPLCDKIISKGDQNGDDILYNSFYETNDDNIGKILKKYEY